MANLDLRLITTFQSLIILIFFRNTVTLWVKFYLLYLKGILGLALFILKFFCSYIEAPNISYRQDPIELKKAYLTFALLYFCKNFSRMNF